METSNNASAKKRRIRHFILSAGSVAVAAAYMPFFLYSTNSAEVKFSEVLFPLGLFVLIAIGIFALSLFVTKSVEKSAVIAISMILLLENYHFVEKFVQLILPPLKYWHILPILVVVMLHIDYLLYIVLENHQAKTLAYVLGAVSSVLIAVNLATAVPNILFRFSMGSDKPAETENDVSAQENDGTNIYYFVFDEGASFQTLKNYYGYEAAELRSFLENSGFTISDNSHNDATNTVTVLTNIINLEYIVKSNAETDNHGVSLSGRNLMENSPLRNVLERNGYALKGVGNTAWLDIESLTAQDSVAEANTIDGQNFVQLLMDNTFLYPLYKQLTTKTQQLILDTFNYYSSAEAYGSQSEFKFTYVKCPHQPFVFDENGKSVSEEHYNDWSDDKYYLNQYKFVMKKIMEAVDHILSNDPKCIIILTSDHGPRFNSNIPGGAASQMPPSTNVLNAVYFKGEAIPEILDQSSVNTLRIVLSKQLHEDLPILDVIYSD